VDIVTLRHVNFFGLIASSPRAGCVGTVECRRCQQQSAARFHGTEAAVTTVCTSGQLVGQQVCHLFLAPGNLHLCLHCSLMTVGHLMTPSVPDCLLLSFRNNLDKVAECTGKHRAAVHRFSWSLCRTSHLRLTAGPVAVAWCAWPPFDDRSVPERRLMTVCRAAF
jgi:hypothetical protein